MNRLVEQWIGAYYPVEMPAEPHTKTIMCLLFDRVVCHFPVADMACGGGHGISEFFSDEPLVKAGVLELREELLLPEVEVEFTPGYYWGTEEEFAQFLQLQIAAMALQTCTDSGATPVTDSLDSPVPASVMERIDLPRFAQLQAVALATQCLEIVIPQIAALADEDILMARDRLNDQLVPFRRSMLALAPMVREGLGSGVSLAEVYREAKYVVETNVAPAVSELQERLQKERGRFWRKLVLDGSRILPKLLLNWATKSPMLAALEGASDIRDLSQAVISRRDLLTSLKDRGGMGYLLAVADYPDFKPKAGA